MLSRERAFRAAGVPHWRSWRTFGCIVLATVIVAGCTAAAASPSNDNGPLAARELEMAVGHGAPLAPAGDAGALAATQINDFGFDLLRHLESKGNLVASPTSIALALAMARLGAKGQTAMEMDKVLHGFGSDGRANETERSSRRWPARRSI